MERFDPATHREKYGNTEAEIGKVKREITGDKGGEELAKLVVQRDALVASLNAQKDAAEDAARVDDANLTRAQEEIKRLTADIEAYNTQIQEITGVTNTEVVRFSAEQARVWFAKRKRELGSIAEIDLAMEGGVVNVSIDRSKTIKDLLEDGAYDSVYEKFAVVFPVVEDGPADLQVFFVEFPRGTRSGEIITELDKLSLRPLTAAELLTVGAKYKYLQRECTLIGLGSQAVLTVLAVPLLWGYGARRSANVGRWDNDWSDGCRFPAVRK